MPRPRFWYVAPLAALVLAPGAGCTSRGDITADSTCGDYLSTQADARHAAAARISTDLHASGAGKAAWGTSLDAECGTARGTKLRAYFAAQQALKVGSVSMEHTINSGDTVLVNTLAYSRGTPRRGDVVEFKAPPAWRADPAEARFVTRVIGTGGDHVTCCDAQHRLTVNGRPLDEPYLDQDDVGRSGPASPDAFDITVPDGRVWVMGDSRFRSGDSREQYLRLHDIDSATLPVTAMTGRVFAVIDAKNQDEIRQLTMPPGYAGIPDPTGRR